MKAALVNCELWSVAVDAARHTIALATNVQDLSNEPLAVPTAR